MPPQYDAEEFREPPVAYSPPPQTKQLVDELYLEEIREARAMDPAAKIRAGQQLFESACRITLAGIRNQNPGASEEQCLEILRQRLEFQRLLEVRT